MGSDNSIQIQRDDSRYSIFVLKGFYAKFSLLLLVITLATLVPRFFADLLAGSDKYSQALIIHGFLFLVWYILFAAQAMLASNTQIDLHKKLGYFGVLFTITLLASGSHMLVNVMMRHTGNIQAMNNHVSYVWAIIHTILSFASFYFLAIICRHRPESHKRFMLLAGLSMMPATITRVAYLPFVPIDGTVVTLLFSYTLLAAPILYELVQHKKAHPVLIYGTGIYVVTQILFMMVLANSPFGLAIAFPFAE